MCPVLAEAGDLAAKSLLGKGITDLCITSRTYSNAQGVASQLGIEAAPWGQLEAEIAKADVVVTSTGAAGTVHGYESVQRATAGRTARPLVIVDIAVPRDVEASVGTLPGVTLFNIDDVQQFAERNLDQRRQEVGAAQSIVAADVLAFQRWWQTQEVLPTVRSLQHKAEAIRQYEVQRTLRRLQASEADQAAIEAMTRAIVKKLLHDPLVYLKARRSGEDALDVVRDLFNLDEPAEQPPVSPAPGKHA